MSHPLDWMRTGSCASSEHPDTWFPTAGGTGIAARAEALAACRDCPVVAQCRAYGLADRELTGIWGGLTMADRIAARKAARQLVST